QLSTNQRPNLRWRQDEPTDCRTFCPAHLWTGNAAGQRPVRLRSEESLHTLSTTLDTGRRVSSTLAPWLSPAPVEEGLGVAPPGGLDSRETGRTRMGRGPMREAPHRYAGRRRRVPETVVGGDP